jgi:putative CocE/NonD family hydrolase
MSLPHGPFEVRVLNDVLVQMRDGVRLATDVYLPVGLERVPALLERTPYDKRGSNHADITITHATPYSKPEIARYFASHGYAYVLQDCRGRYGSEGEFTKYIDEGFDGFDTIRWMTEQPWCDGRVGTLGLSYCAHAQAAVGCLAPRALKAQFLDSGGFSSAYHSGVRQGGAFELKQATWAYKHALLSPATANDAPRRAALQAQDITAWFARMPWRRGDSPLSAAPEYEAYLFDQWERGEFDAYWKQLGLYTAGFYDSYAAVPMVHMSSWYDPYSRTATENFVGLQSARRGEPYLILGPWTHGRRSATFAGDVDFGAASTFDAEFGSFFEVRRQWVDYALRGSGANPFAKGRVAIFVMGGGTGARNAEGRLDHGGYWRWADSWPLPETRFVPLYLRAGDRLTLAPPVEAEAQRTFIADPNDPVPTIGGAVTSGEPVMRAGAFDQREDPRFFGCRVPGRALADREDVCAFITEPLSEDIEIGGPISVRLWVSSDCPDTDITLKLVDVYPPTRDYPQGFAMNLTHGILRMRYHRSWERPEMLEPGRVYEVAIEMFPVANRFLRGHRIRLDIAGSNFPHFDLNPNTGEPQGRWQRKQVAHNTVWLDRQRPSQLILPIIGSFAENRRPDL